jgi:hypothetical protein
MSAREVALEFVRCFCTAEVEGLGPLLAEDLRFTGPLHRFGRGDARDRDR